MAKNCSKHRIINRSPYKALFGSEPKIGLSSKHLPNIILQSITTEEDLNELINTEVSDEVDSDEEEDSEKDDEKINEKDNNVIYACKNCNSKMSIISKESLCGTCVKEKLIRVRKKERVEAFEGQKKATEKMIQASDKKLVIIEVGNYILVNIPKVDRGPLDTQNIIGKVVDKKNNTTDAEFFDEIPDTMLTLREIAKRHFQFGVQGYQKCFCKTLCKTNRCAYRKNNILCSSKCHEKTACNNLQ
ncbi:KRAB-A domain-containing protein 2-like [Aphis craccivora]|uniref:KRAB-A domain-containing protein 2-like n=1 Tax=Aphis craccivora TaxID=307492 RepID=A0A6G0YGF9_APHCR|nr:KRAB-A domain-containing protein 2-like [Aphis craccivora]